MNASVEISIVVPAYNESENIPLLLQEILPVMHDVGRPWEVLFINDASTDDTLETLKKLAQEHPELRYVSFAKNCGQSAGFKAGFEEARGELLITMDADLQNDPRDIPKLLDAYAQGYEMVIGWRADRQDTLAKKWASRFANWVRNKVSRETVKDTGCSLKLMRADLARKLPFFTGMHRFLPTLMKMHGARVAEIKVHHRARKHGASKYGVLDRALTTWRDLLAVRWMQDRFFSYEIKEKN